MPRVSFDALPDHGRLWVFPARRRLDEGEISSLLEAVDGFLDTWAAHGVPLRSGRLVVEDQFLVVGVDEDAEAPSGCSIDALVNELRALGDRLGVGLIDHRPVWYRDAEGAVRCVDRSDFRRLAEEGLVDERTPVFDTTLTRVEALRAGKLERGAGETWHRRAFFRSRAAGD